MAEVKSVIIPREILLVEIDRHCFFPDCNARTFVGLTKQEALEYSGFECVACERWNDDLLTKNEVPDWWSEIVAKNGN